MRITIDYLLDRENELLSETVDELTHKILNLELFLAEKGLFDTYYEDSDD